MNTSISMAYVQGIQARMADAGILKYASEEVAANDAAMLGQTAEELPTNTGGLVQEGAAPEETAVLAQALGDMAAQAGNEAQVASAKADIVQQAVTKLASLRKNGMSKFAMEAPAPGDNLTVAGLGAGNIAPGESNAKATDYNNQYAIPTDDQRPDYHSSMPGQQADAGKGVIGSEQPHPGANGQGGVTPNYTTVDGVPTDAVKPNYYGAPGQQADAGKGVIGTEKTASLSSILSRL